jgi:hypothetical protein
VIEEQKPQTLSMKTSCSELEWALLLRGLDDFIEYLKNPQGAKGLPSLPLLPPKLDAMLDHASEEDCEKAEQEFIKKLVEKDRLAWTEFLCVVQKNPTADQRYKEFMGLSPFSGWVIIPVKKDLGGIVIDSKGVELALSHLLVNQFRNTDFTGTVFLQTKDFIIVT